MEKILEKARVALRNAYVALGATVMPFLVHAGYAMPEPVSNYTIPVQGRVVSEETGEPVVGIRIGHGYSIAITDGDGRFLIYVPERDSYTIEFSDIDGFENGGFFSYKAMTIPGDEIGGPLEVSLYRESQAAVIRGTVRSKETSEPVSGISVSIYSAGDNGKYRYISFSSSGIVSDKDGQFSCQVPERDEYSITFSDAGGLFQWKKIAVTSDEIKESLKVDLEQRSDENGS